MREEATISKNKVQLNKREDNSIIYSNKDKMYGVLYGQFF